MSDPVLSAFSGTDGKKRSRHETLQRKAVRSDPGETPGVPGPDYSHMAGRGRPRISRRSVHGRKTSPQILSLGADMAVTLTIKVGSVVTQARLGAFFRAPQAKIRKENPPNVIQFTYADSRLTYC